MSATDYLRIGERKIFKEVFESLPKNVSKTLNLIAVRDSVLFSWDFQNNCVLSLNLKAARNKQGEGVNHQKLLPLRPPLFSPELLVVNESGTLLVVAGPNGVLVLQLPMRYPPHGAYDNNKEVVYCRSHSLDERLLSCSDIVHVRQAKFHPGSPNDSHLLVLTSDNTLRLYQIENNDAVNLGVYSVGEKPGSVFPGSTTTFLDLYGEIAVDFEFGQPEISKHTPVEPLTFEEEDSKFISILQKSTQTDKIIPIQYQPKKDNGDEKKWKNLSWPVYVLRGDCSVYSINVDLNKQFRPLLRGPLSLSNDIEDLDQPEACSLICLNTCPQILCIAMSNGTLIHSVLLDSPERQLIQFKDRSRSFLESSTKEIINFETVELELGLTTIEDEDDQKKYKCPIFLHKDDSKVSRYFVTHTAGVHTVDISCVEELQNFIGKPDDAEASEDIFAKHSTAEYLICTKTSTTQKTNPVIGFSLYYEPMSVISLLADKSIVTLGLWTTALLPKIENIDLKDDDEVHSPLKKMLNQPFDQFIQSILKQATSQPVLKLASTTNHSQEECFEVLQRASQVFREHHFKQHTKAREELEKRIQALTMLKKQQQKEIDRMHGEKEVLQEKAESLAEKYEDIKDKQDELLKKCEQLLMLVSRKRAEPSDAERQFMADLNQFSAKSAKYGDLIDKVKNKLKYQQIQMENWKAQEVKKVAAIPEIQANTIKNSLEETNKKITEMLKEVQEYKKMLNIS